MRPSSVRCLVLHPSGYYCCTRAPGHVGDHQYAYSTVTWPSDAAMQDARRLLDTQAQSGSLHASRVLDWLSRGPLGSALGLVRR